MTICAGRWAVISIFLFTIIACTDRSSDSGSKVNDATADFRIVTLSPHLAELVFTVGAGDMLVGVSDYSDYPPAVTKLPVIGDAFRIDQERLALLEPDLLLGWKTGTPAHISDNLQKLGFSVELISTTSIDDIPVALRRIGELTGQQAQAQRVASDFSAQLAVLATKYAAAAPVRVFYQLDARPLYTINGDHFVSDLIKICGGTNIFADLRGLAPSVSVEAVLERDPEVLMASADLGWSVFNGWDRWSELAANRYGNLFLLPANEISRATPRLLIAAQNLCDALEVGRQNRHM